jgi:hypothetical protein
MAAGGWLLLRNGDPDSIRAFLPWALGGLLASQGAWLAFRQLRRLLDPEGAAAQEQEEAEREETRRSQSATLPMAVVGWLSAVVPLGFLIAYAVDDSGDHGERTLGLTAFFVGWVIAALVFAIWATRSWRRHRSYGVDRSSA